MIVLIDNYDSFTYNLVQKLGEVSPPGDLGIRHKSSPLEGVQYHPESFLTEKGEKLLANSLKK